MNENQDSYNQNPQMPMMPPPMSPRLMSRRTRWGEQLMAGKPLRGQTIPNWFAAYAVGTYVVALLGVNLINSNYATEWYFWLFGIVWVAGFFYLSIKFSHEWDTIRIRKSKAFEKKLFLTGFGLRVLYSIFIYFFYINMTGLPHEFQAADSIAYLETVEEWSNVYGTEAFWEMLEYQARYNLSDMGFPIAEFVFVKLFGLDASYIIIRIINSILGAYMAVIIYRIASRSFGENTARIAAIFCMLHPVLICYSGIMLKEILMTFLLVLFIDMSDRLLHDRRYTFKTIVPLLLVGLSLFTFRTVLGIVAFMAVFFALIMIDTRIVSLGRKITTSILLIGLLLMVASENIMHEVREVTSTDVRAQQEVSMTKRYGTEGGRKGGNMFAKYAGTAVFAPLIFTIPFPTMVIAEGQEDMRLIHGGNWVRNVMSGFVLLSMFMLLLSGDWRKYTLPLAIMIGYLFMLAFTQFAHSLRFHIPVIPFEMMFAAYAITNMRKKHRNWYQIWCIFMVVTCFAWNWFKLAGRGLA